MMPISDLRSLISAISAVLFALCASAQAEQQGRIWNIGLLSESTRGSNNAQAFLQALTKLGYIEGKNLSIAYRNTRGDPGRIPALAAELVHLNVDLIFAPGTAVALGAKNATRTIPIVFASVADAVGSGLVASLARPGGNLTGLTQISPDLAGKRLEILRDVVPQLSRVAVLLTRGAAQNMPSIHETQTAARQFGVKLQMVDVADANDFNGAFARMAKDHADALIVISTPMFIDHAKAITDVATKYRLPAVYTLKEYVDAGGLLSYGVNLPDLFRRAAIYVDKILKGAKPGDLPVEQPTKFEMVVNLKTAKQIGVRIPASILQQADRAIR
jgi:putative ABC transport system substrate-binding protein